ncbi:MAG: hypothetical protein P4M15_11175 [Alphaproteobacteria bacterium]|nr:hypothetical protein [Alphaproteobacteria bacterium]
MAAFLRGMAFLFVFLAVPAYADIDQLCLKQCINAAGASHAACLTQCSYDVAAAPVAPKQGLLDSKTLSPHNTVTTPIPVGNGVMSTPRVAAKPPEKDYACFNQCLQAHQPYDLCVEHCPKTDVTSVAPNAAAAAQAAPAPTAPFSPYPPPPSRP